MQARVRWHRSLQLRVVSTTLVLSVLVIAVLGFFLVQEIATGLLNTEEATATSQVSAGRTSALGLSSVNVLAQPSSNPPTSNPVYVAGVTARSLQVAGGTAGNYLVLVHLTSTSHMVDNAAANVPWVAQNSVNPSATIPPDLIT